MQFIDYLRQTGYSIYTGTVGRDVYNFFKCPHPEKAKWYVKRKPQSFQCVGCARYCETDDPHNFQLFLPFL